jgi:predicted Holliday junction resolvase-like endonuclease
VVRTLDYNSFPISGKGLKEAVEGKQEKWWQKHEETSQEMRSETEGEAKKEEGKRLEEWIKKTIEKLVSSMDVRQGASMDSLRSLGPAMPYPTTSCGPENLRPWAPETVLWSFRGWPT